MMKAVASDIAPNVITAAKLYGLDRRLFEIDEMPDPEIDRHAAEVAQAVLAAV